MPDCRHSSIYYIQSITDGPLLCGLCFFRQGWDAELPTRIHLFKTLAENGNPETEPKFIAHMFLEMGLVAPRQGISADEFRRQRIAPRGREQYTEAAWRMFPVGSAIWKLMGYQPPLGIVLARAVHGRTESQIAKQLELSLQNVHIRMAKAVRTAVRYLPRDETEKQPDGDGSSDSDRPRAT